MPTATSSEMMQCLPGKVCDFYTVNVGVRVVVHVGGYKEQFVVAYLASPSSIPEILIVQYPGNDCGPKIFYIRK